MSHANSTDSFGGHHGGRFFIEPCKFEDVLPIWSGELWPGRASPIEPCSAMKWAGGVDMALMSTTPSFWRVIQTGEKADTGVTDTPRVVGVLSGHFGGIIDMTGDVGDDQTSKLAREARSYRTRGLWVSSHVRRMGIGHMLMTAAFSQARRESCTVAWTFPRQSSMPFYESVGFKCMSPWLGLDDPGAGEFGPNCYAIATF